MQKINNVIPTTWLLSISIVSGYLAGAWFSFASRDIVLLTCHSLLTFSRWDFWNVNTQTKKTTFRHRLYISYAIHAVMKRYSYIYIYMYSYTTFEHVCVCVCVGVCQSEKEWCITMENNKHVENTIKQKTNKYQSHQPTPLHNTECNITTHPPLPSNNGQRMVRCVNQAKNRQHYHLL